MAEGFRSCSKKGGRRASLRAPSEPLRRAVGPPAPDRGSGRVPALAVSPVAYKRVSGRAVRGASWAPSVDPRRDPLATELPR